MVRLRLAVLGVELGEPVPGPTGAAPGRLAPAAAQAGVWRCRSRAALVAVAAKLLTDLGWTESFLVGALLSPTDPVLSSAVITNPRVPRLVRHSLNLESGLNDGLALPAVLAFTAAAAGNEDSSGGSSCFRTCRGGAVRPRGGVCGVAPDAAGTSPRPCDQLPPEGALRAGRGLRRVRHGDLPPEGNGFIAVFVAAIALGIWRPDIRECFESQSEDIVEIVKLGVFVVSARSSRSTGCCRRVGGRGDRAFTLGVARPVAVFAALAGSRQVDSASKAFMAWFGPRAWPLWRSRCSCSARPRPRASASRTSPHWRC